MDMEAGNDLEVGSPIRLVDPDPDVDVEVGSPLHLEGEDPDTELIVGPPSVLVEPNPSELVYGGAQGPKGDKGDKGDTGEPGTTDHAALSNRDYASAGHTGFEVGGAAAAGDAAHLAAFTHADIALNTTARHTRKHTLDGTSDHTGITGTAANFMALSASGLPVDSGFAGASFDSAGAATSAIGAHNLAYVHGDIALNTGHRGTTSGNPHSVTLGDVGGTTDHAALSNIGTNAHTAIDSHISNVTTNPHAVTASQAGADPAGSASGAVAAHNLAFTHSDIATNTGARHTQGTDQGLDTGGANAVTAAQAKAAYTHSGLTSGNPHAVTINDVGGVAAADKGKVYVDTNDTTLGYINGKLVAGTGITLTTINPGGNETFSIALSTAVITAHSGLSGLDYASAGHTGFEQSGAATDAIDAHNLAFTHSDIATNTGARHTRQHTVTETADHTFPGGTTTFLRADGTFATPTGGWVDRTIVSRDADGYIDEVEMGDGNTFAVSRDADGYIDAVTDDVYSYAVTRDGNGYVTSVVRT